MKQSQLLLALTCAVTVASLPAYGQGTVPISGLPAATTPVAGTEVVPVVQNGVTKKLPLSSITPPSGVTPGTYGDSTHCPSVTVGTDGRVTAASQSATCPGGGVTGANPTATIGPSAVNGSAPTFMRSDAAPPLPATLPALNGSNLTALNPANLSGAVPVAKGGTACTAAAIGCINNITGATGTPSSSTYLRGDGSWSTPTGSGTVSSVATGACLTGGPITSTGTVSATSVTKNDTTTAYAFGSTDACKIITRNNASSMADTLPQASTSGMAAGLGFAVMNYGAGQETITPAGASLIGGASSLVLNKGESCDITVNTAGTGYDLSECKAAPSGVAAGTYGDSTHCANFTVSASGVLSSAAQSTSCPGGGSGVFPVKYISGNYYWAEQAFMTTGTALTAAKPYFISTYVGGNVTLTEMGASIATIGAAGNFQVSVYAADPTTGLPTGAPLATTPSITTGTTFAQTGILTTPVALTPGVYWFGIMADNTTVRFKDISVASNSPVAAQGTNISGIGVYGATFTGPTGTYGTWPSMTGTACGTGNCTTVSGSDVTTTQPNTFFRVQ